MLRLKELRQQYGLSQIRLAEKANISRRTIEEIERRGDCRISTARVICNAMGCTLDEFYTTDEAGE